MHIIPLQLFHAPAEQQRHREVVHAEASLAEVTYLPTFDIRVLPNTTMDLAVRALGQSALRRAVVAAVPQMPWFQ